MLIHIFNDLYVDKKNISAIFIQKDSGNADSVLVVFLNHNGMVKTPLTKEQFFQKSKILEDIVNKINGNTE